MYYINSIKLFCRILDGLNASKTSFSGRLIVGYAKIWSVNRIAELKNGKITDNRYKTGNGYRLFAGYEKALSVMKNVR